MKILNRLKISVTLVAILFMSNSCEDFLDVNTDPDAAIADQASPDLLFAPAIAKLSANRMADAGWFVGLWAQQMNQNGSSGLFRLIENYNQFQVIVQNAWNIGYEDVLKNCSLAVQGAENNVPLRPNAAAQGKLWMAFSYVYMTQFFGDIPFSEALKATEFPTPKPDTQKEVLEGVIAMVDEALAQIDVNSLTPPITNGDLIYAGDMTKWIKFGNSLKLKCLMFLAGKDASYQSQVGSFITSGAQFMTAASDNAESPFFDASNNENNLYKFSVTVSPTGERQSDTWYADTELLDIMQPKNDPRVNIYFQPSRTATTTNILGNSSASTAFNQEVSELSLNILRPDFPDRLLTASETQLFIAEAYARGYVGGSADLAQAEVALRNAINASFDFWNSNVTYDPTVAVTTAARNAYLGQAHVDISAMTTADALNEILEEHYVTLLCRGVEVWTHVRRNNVPALTAPASALFANIPARYLYSNEETSSNEFITNDGLTRETPLWFVP